MGTGGRRGDAMLTGAGLGNDAALSHPLRQKRLPNGVIDLVRPGVVQVFAFEKNSRSAAALGEPLGEIQRAGAAHIVAVQAVELALELRIGPGLQVFGRKLFEGVHKRFGDESPPELAKAPCLVRHIPEPMLIFCIVNL